MSKKGRGKIEGNVAYVGRTREKNVLSKTQAGPKGERKEEQIRCRLSPPGKKRKRSFGQIIPR